MSLLLSDAKVRRRSTRRALPVHCRILLLFSLLVIPALPLFGQIRVEGKVRVEGGQVPAFGVTARAETEDGQLAAQTPVNSEGAFSFDGLKKLVYRLVISGEGFETTQQSLDLTPGITLVLVQAVLVPARKSKGPAAEIARTDAQASKAARTEYEKGASSLKAKDLDGARAHLENAVREYPCYARAQTDLAAVLEERHDLTGAEAALKKARECDPDYIDSYIVLGQMLNGQKRFSDSAQVLEEGVRRSPSSWQFYYQLGVAYYGLAQFVKAEREYQRVMELNPSPPPEFHVKLADVYLREKAYDKAYAQMDQYVKAEPNGRFATKTKNIMQEMKAAGILNQPEAPKK
ncbi:MAG: tetratricopeptide repeat protein [Terriglobia bacterium]|jgi:tetratricopeptide (TPR) repeat protein